MLPNHLDMTLFCTLFIITITGRCHSVSALENREEDDDDKIDYTGLRLSTRAILNPEGCGDSERYFKDYEKCGIYYQCKRMGDGYLRTTYFCPQGQSFDEENQKCSTSQPCSSLPPYEQNQGNFQCDRNYDKHAVPGDCRYFFICHWTGSYYTIEMKQCPQEIAGQTKPTYFHEVAKNCEVLTECFYVGPFPDNVKCKRAAQKFPDPEDCTKYWVCSKVFSAYYPQPKQCASGKYFDSDENKCVTGECPSDENVLPTGWTCDFNGAHHVNPNDCHQYYICTACESSSAQGQWCYDEFMQCPEGEFYDDLYKQCTISNICPQKWMELPRLPGWECNYEGDRHAFPEDCQKFYLCYRCNRPLGWCYTEHTCPEGQTFDDDSMQCVYGTCPQWPPHLPDSWTCEKENELHADPTECNQYYVCLPCPDNYPWCYELMECPDGQLFDDGIKQCVETDVCPQDQVVLPPGWKCEREGEIHVNPDECTQFYSCIRCNKPKGWCYEATTCPGGQYFDDKMKTCVSSKICPQDWMELPNKPGWECDFEEQKNQVPGNCNEFYICYMCDRPRRWCYTQHSCPKGQTFSDDLMLCIVGRCPQFPPVLPPTWSCGASEELNVDPSDCTSFYKCVKCPEKDKPWCYESEECPNGEYFDDFKKICVEADKCPQDNKELPEGWKCEREGEIHVHPDKCTSFYSCIRCSKPSGWCYETTECPFGQYFDDETKKCVFSKICPQDWMELPNKPGWECDFEEQKNQVPNNCSEFYICYMCDRPRRWCYTKHACPKGQTFSDDLMECVTVTRCPQWPPVLPPTWKCSSSDELHVDPSDCKNFYKCVKCPDNKKPWCYESEDCPEGQFFDDFIKRCVTTDTCPQDKDPLPPGWRCEREGEIHVHPDDCSSFFSCIRCSKPGGWCFTATKCPLGQLFDDVIKHCVVTMICPQDITVLPPDLECENEGELNVYESDCNKYYKCLACSKPGGWCYQSFSCPDGQFFDDENKVCVPGPCPQLSGEGRWYDCWGHGQWHAFPPDCRKYIRCLWFNKDRRWVHRIHTCVYNRVFDELTGFCIENQGFCPQDLKEVGADYWPCTYNGELNAYPSNCSRFYQCAQCVSYPRRWCYKDIESCPPGMSFHQQLKICVEGGCPQGYVPEPRFEIKDGWTCSEEDEGHMFPGGDCSRYYRCHRCTKPKGWCYDEHKCKSGWNFDEKDQMCREGICQQKAPSIPGRCNEYREKHANPENCRLYTHCVYLNWGLPNFAIDELECEDGFRFDQNTQACVPGICADPVVLHELPLGDECLHAGELHSWPKDCRKFYSCVQDESEEEWMGKLSSCPEGHIFNDNLKICVPIDYLTVSELCPIWEVGIEQSIWRCSYRDSYEISPYDCTKYAYCHVCPNNVDNALCVKEIQSCPAGKIFDNALKKCVKGKCTGKPTWEIVPDPVVIYNCTEEGNFPREYWCRGYWRCWRDGNGNLWPSFITCGANQMFFPKTGLCGNGWC